MSDHEKKQKLALAIVDFLNQSIRDGTIKEDDKDGVEIAVQCIGEAFGVDVSNKDQVNKLSITPATLPSIFDLFLKTRDRLGSTSSASTSKSTPAPAAPAAPTEEDKATAEKLKQDGNGLMTRKDYDKAIDAYTAAIAKDPTNPIYFSNRAAAYSSKQDHLSAIADAERAIALNSGFAKAYSRLGHAHYCIGDYPAAADAYRRGLEIEPSNASMKNGLANAEERVRAESGITEPTSASASTPPAAGAGAGAGAGGMAGMADMLRGLGGGAGGMPDMASLLQNPMMMQMAQQMMANGGLERLMGNPSVANMMNRMRNGGEMPSLSELMADPTLRDMYTVTVSRHRHVLTSRTQGKPVYRLRRWCSAGQRLMSLSSDVW
ncbi:hypothetical protein K488DRAFT_49817 [Vararia minispora EC-137]|uniref:Uncharacterized protein n=1 Tax=Vararia minispora EC-137 TaxID=1314806 RepID=A0ACB8QKZ3_9AGAM|nr:hypothetical protein K488DRAFT_49817 [Vararia minispora EC-137]